MKQILCFGDSNTYGLIPGTANQRYGWGTRWTSILDDKVRTKGYRVIEEGLCGRTTVFDDPFRTERRGTEMLPAILESHRPVDTIVLMLGTNDCKSVYSATPEVIGQGIEQLLDQINTVNPDAKILLVSPIYLGERIWEEDFDPEFDKNSIEETLKPVYGDNIDPEDLVVEGGVVDSEETTEDADKEDAADTDETSDDTKDAETTEEPEETEAAEDAE